MFFPSSIATTTASVVLASGPGVARPLPETAAPSVAGDATSSDDHPPRFRTVVDPNPDDDALAAQRRLDAQTPGFASAVDVGALPGATPDDGLAEVIARTPGAHVRSLGGLGQFSSVSLRGSAPQQVAIFMDGVPLGANMAGLVNLADIPLDGIERVETYRGHVPIRYGSAAIGGAIDLVSTAERGRASTRARAGLGSFGARSVGASVSRPLTGDVQLTARASYGGATGDFPYYDNAGTDAFTGDDVTRRRTNNDYDRALAQLRIDGERGPWRWSAQQWFVGRWSGIAGPIGAVSEDARLSTLAGRSITTLDRFSLGGVPGARLSWRFGLGVLSQRFRDPAGELGLNVDDQQIASFDVFISPRFRHPLWRGAFLGLVADVRPEWVRVDEQVREGVASGNARRHRTQAGAGVELDQFLFDRRWLLAPAVRVEGVRSRFAVPLGEGEPGDAGRDDAVFGLAPRVGTRVRVAGPLSLRASAGRYFRPPTLLELFGDRGYIVGNEGLNPERGTAVDGGIVVDAVGDAGAAHVGAAGFATWSEDLITWTAAGRVTRPQNIDAARVRGVEVSGGVEPARRLITVHANYTFTDSENRGPDPTFRGKPLPGRPRHDAFVRWTSGVAFDARTLVVEPRILYTAEVVAGTNLDPAGRLELPPRLLQGVGMQVDLQESSGSGSQRGHVAFAFEVRNLLDVRTAAVQSGFAASRPTPVAVSDFIGFPLPGRSLWASIAVDFELEEGRR